MTIDHLREIARNMESNLASSKLTKTLFNIIELQKDKIILLK
jgi:hypothetical protein